MRPADHRGHTHLLWAWLVGQEWAVSRKASWRKRHLSRYEKYQQELATYKGEADMTRPEGVGWRAVSEGDAYGRKGGRWGWQFSGVPCTWECRDVPQSQGMEAWKTCSPFKHLGKITESVRDQNHASAHTRVRI